MKESRDKVRKLLKQSQMSCDDIDIGHVDTSDTYVGAENRTYRTTSIGGSL